MTGPDALEIATRLAGRIRDLVDSASAESVGVDVSAAVGLQIGAGNGSHRAPRPTLSSVGASAPGHVGPVPLPTFVAPAPRPATGPVAQAGPAAQAGPIEQAGSVAPAGRVAQAVLAGPAPIGGRTTAQPSPHRVVDPPGGAATAALRIYPARRVALLDGDQLSLTRREFDLLLFLSEHAGRVFDRPQLLRLVWGHQVICGERTVDVHIRRLRAKVERTGPVISTVRGVGYRLDAPERVEVVHEGE